MFPGRMRGLDTGATWSAPHVTFTWRGFGSPDRSIVSVCSPLEAVSSRSSADRTSVEVRQRLANFSAASSACLRCSGVASGRSFSGSPESASRRHWESARL